MVYKMMDTIEEARKAIEEMSDEDFLDLYYSCSWINRYRSKRYFKLKSATDTITQIVDIKERIHKELEKLERHSLISEIKTSIAR